MLRLLDAVAGGALAADPVLVMSDTAQAAGLGKAAERGIATAVCTPRDFGDADSWASTLSCQLEQTHVDLIALAGFMRILPPRFCRHWLGKLVNIHPSLLPRHKGLNTHQRALDAGDKEAGCSVHFVTAELDGGPVIAQARVPVTEHDTATTLSERVLAREHVIYPLVLSWCATGRVSLVGDAVRYEGRNLVAPLQV